MKKITLLMTLILGCYHHLASAQNTFCDSISVDSVYIENNMLHITVYNNSQHFIAYPFFTINLVSNNYISLTDSVLVLSFLSIPGDANNGYSTAYYSGNMSASNLVPLNTNFLGTIIITDPNDSTFNCSYSFNFNYGTMPTTLVENSLKTIKIFPNPTSNLLSIKSNLLNQNSSYTIYDQVGTYLLDGSIDKDVEVVDIGSLEDGIYFLRINDQNSNIYKIIKNN